MYSLRDIMEMFKIPERTIRRHIKEGILVGSKIGGVWKFTQDELTSYVGTNKVQKHISDEGFKEITDYYRGFVEDKSEVVYMFIKQFDDQTNMKKFFEVTELFKCEFSLNCRSSAGVTRYTFKGQRDDLIILMKWSEEFQEISKYMERFDV